MARTSGGSALTMSFDSRARLLGITATGLADLDFEYDAVGNLTSYINVTTGSSKSMTYDSLDRLITANGPWSNASYSYDALGNRTMKKIGSRRPRTRSTRR